MPLTEKPAPETFSSTTAKELYGQILNMLRDAAAPPSEAMAACLSVAALLAKVPPPGRSPIHVNRFLKLCKECYRALDTSPKIEN